MLRKFDWLLNASQKQTKVAYLSLPCTASAGKYNYCDKENLSALMPIYRPLIVELLMAYKYATILKYIVCDASSLQESLLDTFYVVQNYIPLISIIFLGDTLTCRYNVNWMCSNEWNHNVILYYMNTALPIKEDSTNKKDKNTVSIIMHTIIINNY